MSRDVSQGKLFGSYGHGGTKSIEFTRYGGVFAVDSIELTSEVCSRQVSKWITTCSTGELTFLRRFRVVRSFAKASYVLRQPNPRPQLGCQDVALVEEKHEIDLGQKLVRAYCFPKQDRIFLFGVMYMRGGGMMARVRCG